MIGPYSTEEKRRGFWRILKNGETQTIVGSKEYAKHLVALLNEAHADGLKDAAWIARGCLDYGGGHHGDGKLEAFHHGISTVAAALEGAVERGIGGDSQVAALRALRSPKDENLIFERTDRGFTVRATKASATEARVEIFRDGSPIRISGTVIFRPEGKNS